TDRALRRPSMRIISRLHGTKQRWLIAGAGCLADQRGEILWQALAAEAWSIREHGGMTATDAAIEKPQLAQRLVIDVHCLSDAGHLIAERDFRGEEGVLEPFHQLGLYRSACHVARRGRHHRLKIIEH